MPGKFSTTSKGTEKNLSFAILSSTKSLNNSQLFMEKFYPKDKNYFFLETGLIPVVDNLSLDNNTYIAAFIQHRFIMFQIM